MASAAFSFLFPTTFCPLPIRLGQHVIRMSEIKKDPSGFSATRCSCGSLLARDQSRSFCETAGTQQGYALFIISYRDVVPGEELRGCGCVMLLAGKCDAFAYFSGSLN